MSSQKDLNLLQGKAVFMLRHLCSGEGAYRVESSVAGGTRVVLVASEPITRSSGDWVAVPKNTALVISRDKDGHMDVVRTPLHRSGKHNRQEEIKM